MKRLQRYLNEITEEYGVPSWQCRVIHEDKIILDEKSVDYDESRYYYYIYSMTKLITSIATMKLIEDGKLSLEDEVAVYLPEFKEMTVKKGNQFHAAKNRITITHLLTMQGGYDYSIKTPDLQTAVMECPKASTQDLVKVLAKRPLLFEPGEGFAYSLCYDVLGAVIEAACNMTLGEYFRTAILIPLGMKDTTFQITEDIITHMAKMYQFDEDQRVLKEVKPAKNMYVFSDNYESGGAGLISTFNDYFQIVRLILQEGSIGKEQRLLRSESIKQMYKRYMTDAMLYGYDRYKQWGTGYSFGLRSQENFENCPKAMSKEAFEISGAAGSYAFWDMKNKLAVLYFQHVNNLSEASNVIHHKIRDLIYDCLA